MSPLRVLRPLLAASLAWVASGTSAQEHPFLSLYTLTELEGGIRIDWTILGGSTCDGQEIERSTDGLAFTSVHRIEGLCGDPFIARSYGWFDPAPPEFSTVHYRVKLGADGYSSVKSVRFDQLVTNDQLFFPNPANDQATLVLNLPASSRVDLQVFDAEGRLVIERKNHRGPLFDLELEALGTGLFTYLAISNERRFIGRFVKA
jgi:hypothetical protein